MSKEEKKKLLLKYKNTEFGASFMKRLYRLRLIGIFCLIYSIGYYIIEYQKIELIDYLMLVPLFLAGILFFMMSYKLQRKVLIRYAVEK